MFNSTIVTIVYVIAIKIMDATLCTIIGNRTVPIISTTCDLCIYSHAHCFC